MEKSMQLKLVVRIVALVKRKARHLDGNALVLGPTPWVLTHLGALIG